ncbi:hypothetical protein AOLI_G00175240 [Acnodon oligacanthus]
MVLTVSILKNQCVNMFLWVPLAQAPSETASIPWSHMNPVAMETHTTSHLFCFFFPPRLRAQTDPHITTVFTFTPSR